MVSHKRSLSRDPITIYKYSLWGTGKINTRKEKKLLKLAGDVDTNTSRYLLATDCQENSSGGVPSVVKFRTAFPQQQRRQTNPFVFLESVSRTLQGKQVRMDERLQKVSQSRFSNLKFISLPKGTPPVLPPTFVQTLYLFPHCSRVPF